MKPPEGQEEKNSLIILLGGTEADVEGENRKRKKRRKAEEIKQTECKEERLGLHTTV